MGWKDLSPGIRKQSNWTKTDSNLNRNGLTHAYERNLGEIDRDGEDVGRKS